MGLFMRIREDCRGDISSLEALCRDEKDPADLSALSVLGGRRMERVSEA